MSDNKRYYWLKLDVNFFEDDTIVYLSEHENGNNFIIFYLRLCLKSLSEDGYLMRYVGQKTMPYDNKSLAKLTNVPVEIVEEAMQLFMDIGLITQLETGELYLNQINEMIGSETESAKRVRRHRAKKALENDIETPSNNPLLQCNGDVILCNTEKEIEKEIEKDIDIDIEKERDTDTDIDTEREAEIERKRERERERVRERGREREKEREREKTYFRK
ncbi:phage replisome organizer N-terminal domain-containing protein [Aerococcaceae bacterium zg-BR9]|uniref:phage replisome organizer N-terminal domain-containing protein n=1 Tax=Aerococcaceae bacterium zg-1292 TaxID=2774330 RepID=UPI004064AFEC|nr:phage replisome organizer N-terminal domain-containing protein [Aerococcaceae bacterium zg-BR9]